MGNKESFKLAAEVLIFFQGGRQGANNAEGSILCPVIFLLRLRGVVAVTEEREK